MLPETDKIETRNNNRLAKSKPGECSKLLQSPEITTDEFNTVKSKCTQKVIPVMAVMKVKFLPRSIC